MVAIKPIWYSCGAVDHHFSAAIRNDVPLKAVLIRSASVASASRRTWSSFPPALFRGESCFINLRLTAPEGAERGTNSPFKEDNITWYKIAGRAGNSLHIAQHLGLRRDIFFKASHRLLGTAFLHHAMMVFKNDIAIIALASTISQDS